MHNNFQLISECVGDGDVKVTKYKSSQTGLTIVIGNVEGPLVNGYLTIATEAFDDDGIPHTLEHLIFLGSEDYPYKGVLDLCANRCFADGTNAWTDTDHTCYTLTTAGSDGFLNLLPIYLDHVLFPTLTDSGFITEVHHIDGNGQNAGVVYCEMQARENTGEELCHHHMLRAIYPGKSGYKSNTGGMMKNLRESTTNENIRKFHQEFYRSQNLCVIITGVVDHEAVFKSVQRIEEKIIRKGTHLIPYVRPWETPVDPFPATVEQVVKYPCDDDDNGMVYIGWRGPRATDQYEELTALTMLTEYLNDTAVSPLQHEFVEQEDPYCGSVSVSIIENAESCIYLSFESIDREKLYLIKDKLFQVLTDIVKGDIPFDMTRMENILHRQKMQILSSLENSAHSSVASAVIGDFLYGHNEEDLLVRIRRVPQIDALSGKEKQFWTNMITHYFLDSNYALIVGEPSPETMQKMSDEEEERLNKQRELIGVEGLKVKGAELEAAKKNNEIPPPDEMIRSVLVPSVDNIKFHQIVRSNNHSPIYLSGDDILGFNSIQKIPFKFQIDSIKTNFVTIRVLLNTSNCLSPAQRLYLSIWSELITESPIIRKGVLVPYEQVVNDLNADTIHNGTDIGVGSFAQIAQLMVKIEMDKYHTGIEWLKELLFFTQFTPERIKVIATRMVNEIAQAKRKGSKVASTLTKAICFNSNSNHWAVNMYRQQKFLNSLLKRMEISPDEVIGELNQVRELITDRNNITVHLSLSTDKLNQKSIIGEQLWMGNFIPESAKMQASNAGESNLCNNDNQVTMSFQTLLFDNIIGDHPIPRAAIAGVGSVETNYMLQCVQSINAFDHPDIPAVLVLIQYLTQLEGPMWRQIRGMGLSYHYNLILEISEGLLYLILYKATHLVASYREAFEIVKKHVSGETQWDESLLESSRSSLVYEIISREKSVAGVSSESMMSYLCGISMDYKKKLIASVSHITLADLKRVAPIYLLPLFDVNKSKCAICCHPSKVEETIAGFKEFGRNLESINLEQENFTSAI